MTIANKKQVPLALQFRDLENPGKPIAIDKLFVHGSPKSSSSWGGAIDQVWCWNTTENTWRKYGYHKPSGQTARWERCDTTTSPVKWTTLAADDVVNPGQTFIFYNGATTNVTLNFSGEIVPLSDSLEFTIPNKKQMFIAFPWPVENSIEDIGASYAGKSSSSWGGAGDQIWFWHTTENTWRKYGNHKPSGQSARWERCDTTTSPVKWSVLQADDVVPAGQGFILYNGATTNITVRFTLKK